MEFIKRIITHINVDLDAVCSVWAAMKFVPRADKATIEFYPANWDEMHKYTDEFLKEQLMVLDMDAGGRGLKGAKDADGTVHSCFASTVSRYGSDDEKSALEPLIRFVDAQDAHGSAVKFLAPEATQEAQEILSLTGINSVLRALQSTNPNNDLRIVHMMSEILDGMLKVGLSRQRAEKEADRAEILPGGNVAIVTNSREFGTHHVLFEKRGVKMIVYSDGYNLGIVRGDSGSTLRADDPQIRTIVEAAGELDEWFAHPAGFLFCRGSRKAPATTPSQVDPHELALAAYSLF